MKKTSSLKKIQSSGRVSQDFKNALLIVSLVANAFVLTTWMVAKLSPSLAAQLARLI